MKWSLRRKVLAGYGLLILLTGATVAWSVRNIQRLGTASSAILRENYRSILAMDEMGTSLLIQDRAALLVLLGETEQAKTEFARQTASFYEWYGRELDNITIPGEGSQANQLGGAYGDYQRSFARFMDIAHGDPAAARTFYNGTLHPLVNRVRSDIAALKNLNQTTMYNASARAERVAAGAILSVVIFGLVLIVVGSAFSIILSRIIVRPLARLIDATANIAEGSYGFQLKPSSEDELGTLTRSFNAMVRNIKSSSDLKISQLLAEKWKSEAIVQAIDDGVIVIDGELKVVLVNPAAERFLGSKRHMWEHPHLLEVMNNPSLFDVIKKAVEEDEPANLGEYNEIVEVEHDGVIKYYQIGINPIRSEGDASSGVVLLARDVTRLKEVENLKSEFVMTASHELKTPLTGIGMSIALLKESLEGRLAPKEAELFEAASQDTARLTALVHDLLDLSRIEAGQMALDFQSVPPALVLERACEAFRQQAQEKGVELRPEIEDDVPEVRADITKTTWVVTNLIANALRHTPSGGRILCSATNRGEWVHFAVSDNGTGIPLEDQTKIFEKFGQVKGESGGTGLGLAICREIVRASGGTIWVDSEPGKGSTFTFTLSAAKARHGEKRV